MELKIATHNGIFHADEVTAVALLKLFTDNEITLTPFLSNRDLIFVKTPLGKIIYFLFISKREITLGVLKVDFLRF